MNNFLKSLFLLVISYGALAAPIPFYAAVFDGYDRVEKIPVTDTINKAPSNLVLKKFSHNKKTLGFARNINTTTGCSSACLPVSYTAFYSAKGDFITVKSRSGLTKIDHAPFSKEDYSQLDFILSMAPKIFDQIVHPKEMTDAISGATKKAYMENVIKGAAYSTLRIHLYNQDTLKQIKNFLKK
ncbi:MAG: hypothetical protein HON90_07920 [Halobacteriovoraceae bacterium]|jgi:hypothetical protein|nr:hypothetical protein [Halobacteriovoraceae bacterium]